MKYTKILRPALMAALTTLVGIGGYEAGKRQQVHIKGSYFAIPPEQFPNIYNSSVQVDRSLTLEEKCRLYSFKYRFLEYIPNQELYRYCAIADIFVLPSITTQEFKEPWGIVINEAMSQGCPVIATDAVGAAMGGLVENGKTGFIVPERNTEELKRAIEILLKDNDLKQRMSQSARQKMTTWNPQQTADGFVKAIEFAFNE